MFNFKKLLSIALGLSITIIPIKSSKKSIIFAAELKQNETFDIERYCDARKREGLYLEECASYEAEEILKSGKQDYVSFLNTGPLADTKFYYFNFKALDKILETINFRNGNDILNEINKLDQERSSRFSKIKVIPKMLLGAIIGTLSGKFLANSISSNSSIRRRTRTPANAISTGTAGFIKLIGAACGTILSGFIQNKQYNSYSEKIDQLLKKSNANELKEYALEGIKDFIDNSNYFKKRDILVIKGYPNRCWGFEGRQLELNYTEEEKAEFKQSFKKLSDDIAKALGKKNEN